MTAYASRLRLLEPDKLTGDQREVYDRILATRGAPGSCDWFMDDRGRLLGPFNAMLYSPRIGSAVSEVGAAIRAAPGLPPTLRELIILTVAVWRDCSYEWDVHVDPARRSGISEQELTDLRAQKDDVFTGTAEAVTHELVVTLLSGDVVDEESYRRFASELGEALMVETAMVTGYYDTLATVLRLFADSEEEKSVGSEG